MVKRLWAISIMLCALLTLASCAGLPSISVVTATSDVPAVQESSTTPEPSVTPESALQEASPSDTAASSTPNASPGRTPDIDPTDAVHDPEACGFGPLPLTEPNINEADWEAFNSAKLTDYLLSAAIVRSNEFYIQGGQVIDGTLYLTVAVSVYVPVDEAYSFLSGRFGMTFEEFTSLPEFEDCVERDGEVYTQDALEYIDHPEDYEDGETEISSYSDLNIAWLDDITLESVPVADDAVIIRYSCIEGVIGYVVPMDQFRDCILGDSYDYLDHVLFKCSKGVITAIVEYYTS